MLKSAMIEHLRVIALAETDTQTYYAWYDSICRWYSREFNTALQAVEELPEEKVISTYYKDVYWKLKTGNEKQQEAFDQAVEKTLIEFHPDYAQVDEEIGEQDDDWYQQELAEYEKQLEVSDKIGKYQNKTSKVKAPEEPNLAEEPQHIFIEADDPPVDDEGF